MPARLAQLLDPSRISLQLQSDSRTAALNEVARLLEGHPDITRFDGFYAELLARERLDTTCLGNQVALPHARTEHVKKIVMAVGRSPDGVRFGGDDELVRLIFVLATPKNNPGDYLNVVSALCKVLKDAGNRNALLEASTPDAFVAAVVAAENRIWGSPSVAAKA